MVSNRFTDVDVVENVTVFYVLYTPEQSNRNAKKRKATLLSFVSSYQSATFAFLQDTFQPAL